MDEIETEAASTDYDPKMDLATYRLPDLDLLNQDGAPAMVTEAQLNDEKRIILETLGHENLEVEGIKATIGPRAVLYELIPSRGVRIAQINGMEADIALRLGKLARVVGAMPGKGTIGIEVPHQDPEIVTMHSVLASAAFSDTTMELPMVLGRTLDNQVHIVDLAILPHLLIAGATGQGKSVAINAMIVSLLYKKHPAELKFVLIDVNNLELSPYWRIERHFLAKLPDTDQAVITNVNMASRTLQALCLELDQRYELFKSGYVRDISGYNQKFKERRLADQEKQRYLPAIVVVIDEFSDLITADDQVEGLITRLAQLGRPAGINLILSTQRPSTKVLTGNIKANFISRVAFKTASSVDSKTIIDQGGAEKLEGDGDLLFYTGGQPQRLQGPYVSTKEVERVGDHILTQRGYPTALLLPDYQDEVDERPAVDLDDLDPLFEEAARLVVMHQQGSTSLIQRKLKLGYNRTGRIVDQLEATGIVGPFEGSRAREVLFADEYTLSQHLDFLRTGIKTEIKSEPVPVPIPPPVVKRKPSPPPPPPIKKRSFLDKLFGK